MGQFIKGFLKPLFRLEDQFLQTQFSVTWSAYTSVLVMYCMGSDLSISPAMKAAGSEVLL